MYEALLSTKYEVGGTKCCTSCALCAQRQGNVASVLLMRMVSRIVARRSAGQAVSVALSTKYEVGGTKCGDSCASGCAVRAGDVLMFSVYYPSSHFLPAGEACLPPYFVLRTSLLRTSICVITLALFFCLW